jgi:1,2-diacylglycerol 3-alpha-glucosyltransferase
MRILFTTATYLPSINGVAYQIDMLKQELLRQNHQVLILAPNHPRQQPDPAVCRYPSISSPLAYNYPLGIPFVNESVIKAFKPQVIHTHHPFHIGFHAQELAKTYGCPLFFTHHSSYEDYVNVYIPFAKSMAQKIVAHHLVNFCRRVQSVICPSPHMVEVVNQMGITNTQLIPNGIDALFHPQGPKNKHLSLIYVGRLSPEKNLLPTLKLLQAILKIRPHASLTLIGEGSLQSELTQYAQKNHLVNHVHFLGPLKRTALPRHLSRHHFFISYSFTESFSLSHLEALACGVPLLIPPKVSLGAFVTPQNSLSLPASYSQAATLILKTFNQTKTYQNKVTHAITTAQNFSIQNTTESHLNLYQRFLNSD